MLDISISGSSGVANVGWNTFAEYIPLGLDDVKKIADESKVDTIQLFQPISSEEATLLNDEVFSKRSDITLSFKYANDDGNCDLGILSKLSNVRRLMITDDISGMKEKPKIVNAENLSSLKNLDWLSFDAVKEKDFSFLKCLNPEIRTIALEIGNKSANFDIESLLQFNKLQNLSIRGWKKGIEKLRDFNTVKSLILRGITIDDYSFINRMNALTELSIRWGKSTDLSALYGNANIETLEFWRVSNMDNVDILAHLPNLKVVYLKQLKNIKSFPDLSKLSLLKEIRVEELSSLDDFTSFEAVPNLEKFYGGSNKTILAESLIPVLKNPSLKGFYFNCGNVKEQQKLNEYIKEHMREPNNPPKWQKFALLFDLIGG